MPATVPPDPALERLLFAAVQAASEAGPPECRVMAVYFIQAAVLGLAI
jgi:hypothetical protein